MASGSEAALMEAYDGTGVHAAAARFVRVSDLDLRPSLTPSLGGAGYQPAPVLREPAAVAPVAAQPARPVAAARTTPCDDLYRKARRLRSAADQCDTDVANGAPYCTVSVTFSRPSIPRSLSAGEARGYAAQFEAIAGGRNESVCRDNGGEGEIPLVGVPTELQPPSAGVGPIYRRSWNTIITGGLDAWSLMNDIKSNINKYSRGGPVSDTPFIFRDGPDPYRIAFDNIYGIDGPAGFNPYVKVTSADSYSFEFTTMKGHPEAGQVRFEAYDSPHGTVFNIRVYGRPATSVDQALYGLAGYWVQTKIWDNFTEKVRANAGGASTPVSRRTTQE